MTPERAATPRRRLEKRFRVLVCGGRNWNERQPIRDALNELLQEHGNLLVITGGAPGADTQAATAAAELSLHAAVVKPLWRSFGKGAGQLRNRVMLELEPDLVVAFPGGRGTANMVEQATMAGVPIWQPKAASPTQQQDLPELPKSVSVQVEDGE